MKRCDCAILARRIGWDEHSNTLAISLPLLEVAGEKIDLGQVRDHLERAS